MAEQSYLTAELLAQIGSETEPEVYEVTTTGIRMFARAIGYADRVFYDEEYAKSLGHRSLPAPPAFLGQAVYDPEQSDPTFSRRRGTDFETPLARRLNGGTEYEYREPIYAGDVLTMTERITDLKERTGAMGPMLIAIREQLYRNPEGRIVAIFRGTSINY